MRWLEGTGDDVQRGEGGHPVYRFARLASAIAREYDEISMVGQVYAPVSGSSGAVLVDELKAISVHP